MKPFSLHQKSGKHTFQPIGKGSSRHMKLPYPTFRNWVPFILLFLTIQAPARNNSSSQPWQFVLSTGIHSYYAPVENLKWGQPDFVASLGMNKLLGQKQNFAIGIHGQFSQYEFQGDAVGLQLLAQFTPVIFRRFELGFGTGAGYRLSLYSTKPLKWDGDKWGNGQGFKGVAQVPVQFSLGYRSVRINSCEIRPFAAYQLQALFRYSPDLSPLPDSNLMFGLKLHFNQQ